MRKTHILPFIFLAGILLSACGLDKKKAASNATGQEQTASATLSTEEEKAANESFFMLQDDTLPQSIDLGQDISHLNYQNLRLLRSYVYAIHAHWFMEGDLNTFFSRHTSWYYNLTWDTWFDSWDGDQNDTSYVSKYFTALDEDYPSSYKFIKLSPEEQQFVDKVDERMKLLKKDKSIVAEGGEKLLNPALGVNWYQLWKPDERMGQLMRDWNVAFEPTKYEQLFNIYENNDYAGMPSFVTTDLFLQAFHMYFSYVLKSLEAEPFEQNLRQAFLDLLLECCSEMECSEEMQEAEVAWISTYCMVGLNLLGCNPAELLGNHNLSLSNALGRYKDDFLPLVVEEVSMVLDAEDKPSPLFRTENNFDYSLFRPRGHYSRKESSQRYFRAMMWLQKGCFMREEPEQLSQAIRLARVLNASEGAQKDLRNLNQALTFLMGTPDNVAITELAAYMQEKGIEGSSEEEKKQLDEWLKGIFRDRNRIAPKEKMGPQDQINLMPQRYTLDGEILGTIYDPLKDAEKAYPSGLDVMDVLGSEAAHALVDTLCKPQKQWGDYAKERKQIGERMNAGTIGWDLSMYNKWMQSLIDLQKQEKSQPSFMQTKAWKLKNLNTALASWALLKHDAILYAEQPMGAECGGGGMPDPTFVGYVEPNVPFWKRMLEMLELNKEMLQKCGYLSEDLDEKTRQLKGYVEFCLKASEKEIGGEPLDAMEYSTIQHIGASMEWFTLSIVDPEQTFDMWDEVKGADRCIAQVADVFTRNILGCSKDGILYEAAGLANAIYVIVEIEGESYLTRGATYSYYEFVRPMGQRLTDEEWQQMLQDGKAPAQPDWLAPWLMGEPVESDERFIYQTGC